jgi:Cu/Zn superoxide dismutase
MRIVLGVGLVAAAVAAAVIITAVVDDGAKAPAAEQVRLAADNGSPVRGVAYFEQNGDHLTGSVVVWGLEPGTKHAVHFHGRGRCGTKADPVAAHADLKANADGIAYADIDVPTGLNLLGGGFYYNVHARPAAVGQSPEIACGDIGALG